MTSAWYVASTENEENAEEKAANGLIDLGCEVYVPLKFSRETFGRKVLARPDLRFPGYVIVELDIDLGEHKYVRQVSGVADLLPVGSLRPHALKPDFIPTMRLYEIQEHFRARDRRKPKPRKDIRQGDRVIIEIPPTKIGNSENVWNGREVEVVKVEGCYAKVLDGWAIEKIELDHLRKPEPPLEDRK